MSGRKATFNLKEEEEEKPSQTLQFKPYVAEENSEEEEEGSSDFSEDEGLQIPLSDGATIVPEQEIIDSGPTEEEIREAQEREIRLQEQTRQSYAQNLGKSIAEQVAKSSVNKTVNNFVDKGKQQEKLKKTLFERKDFEKALRQDCIILNAYREKYQGKINFKFKKNYQIGLVKPEEIEQHLEEVRDIINGKPIPALLNNAIEAFAKGVTRLSITLDFPWFNLASFYDRVMLAKREGFFDDEIEQLSIELNRYLSQDPKTRLALKLSMIALNSLSDGMPHAFHEQAKANIRSVDPKKAQDLSNKFKGI